MKRKNLRLSLTSLMVLLLVGVMAVSSAFTAFTGKSIVNSIGSTNSAIHQGATPASDLKSNLDPDNLVNASNVPKSTDRVELIVNMDEESLIDIYLANPGSYESFADYRLSIEGRKAAENLKNRQLALFNKIARQVNVTLKYNYVNALNGFAMEITYGDRALIDSIAKKAKIKGTELSHTYAAPDTTVVENQVSAQDTGIFDSSNSIAKGYGGQGTVVAILDTGIDWEHIAFDPYNPIFAKDNEYKFDEEYIEGKLTQLAAYQHKEYDTEKFPDRNEDYDKSTKYLAVADVYKNTKIPFAYDYADADPEVSSHYDNLHGTHVAGIVAGHSDTPKLYTNAQGVEETYLREVTKNADGSESVRYYQRATKDTVDPTDSSKTIKKGERIYNSEVTDANTKDVVVKGEVVTGITGVAPKAQLAVFKVFPDFDSASSNTHILAALEDCVTLDVDVINMSLGIDCGFQDDSQTSDTIYDVYEKLSKTGISIAVAASNSYSSSFNSYYGLNLTSNPDSATVGTPGTYAPAMSVASISGVPSQYLLATNGQDVNSPSYKEYGTAYYTDPAHLNGDIYEFMEEIYKAVDEKNLTQYKQDDGSLKIPYVTISGTGMPANYVGKDVTDKIALVSRGNNTFEDKIKIATDNRALACIIFNNSSGVIRMNIGDDIKIPACSITMDDAANIKYKDTEEGAGYFIINKDAKAGPFMSEFSSWGPTPDLGLKPEITAHGGDIYSAVPGNETAYERMSGTSMACPNMAGVFAILHQYMKTQENGKYTVAEKFGLWDKEKNEIDKVRMEHRIDQILMSTATIANNEEGNPYSPRKQGAGLADLDRSLTTEQYLITKDKEGNETSRAKLELGDDPKKTGEYNMEFYAVNVGATPVQYTIDSFVQTEGISSNGKTVTEKAYMLNGVTKSFKAYDKDNNELTVTDGKITVPAGEEVKISYKVVLGNEDREWLENFENGMYVEGFVCLKNVTEGNGTKIDLNIPFLAFYGDWSKAPIFDYDIYQVTADENDDNINEEDKRYSNTKPLQLIGKLMENGTEYVMGLGSFPFIVPEEYEDMVPDALEDYCALSFNNESCIFNLYCVGGFLRGAKKVFYTITDPITGEVMLDDVYYCARKAAGAGSFGGAWIDIDVTDLVSLSGKEAINNARYNVAIYPVLDWCSPEYPSDTFTNKEAVIEFNEKYNREHPDDKRQYTWSSDFWIDTDAPFLSNTELRIERDKKDNASYYIDYYVTDNHYACAMAFDYWHKTDKEFDTAFSDDGLYPINSDRNATTRVSFEITGIWDQIQDGIKYLNENKDNPKEIADHPELGTNLTKFHITLYDYAFNRSYYEIDLMSLLSGYDKLTFGEITNTRDYTRSSTGEVVEVMTSVNDTLTTLSDNSYKIRTSLNMIPGQKLPLAKAIIPDPVNACRDFLKFSISGDASAYKYDEETQELYALQPGEIYVTASSDKYNGDTEATATLAITVLSEDDIADLGIDKKNIQAQQTLSGLRFDEGYKTLNAGEEYIIEALPDPWYYEINRDEYFINWTISDSMVATLVPIENESFQIKVVGAKSSYDENNKYVPNITGSTDITATLCRYDENGTITDSATGKKGVEAWFTGIFTVSVLPEFVVEGGVLNEYHGYGDTLVIPAEDLTITTIGRAVFYENNDIKYIEIGEGVQTISDGAFAYMRNLRSVKFPSTLYYIGRNAFTSYYSFETESPETQLTILDTTACTKRPIEVCPHAFTFQRYIGVDWDESEIDVSKGIEGDNKIVLIPEEESKFDTRMIKSVGEYGFYGLAYLTNIDLSGLRGAETASFYYMGSEIHNHVKDDKGNPQYAKVVFGEDTYLGEASFGQHGIGSLTLPMRRITQQSLFGNVEFSDDDEPIPGYIGELEEIIFTADGLVIEDAAFLYSSVKRIKFEGWVDTIGEAAFAYAKNLKTVEFCSEEQANGHPICRVIGAQAFMETGIEEITLPDGLQALGQAAFFNCASLQKVKISDGCKLLEAYQNDSLSASSGAPFYGCDKIQSFEVSEHNEQLVSKNGILYSKDNKMLVNVPVNVDVTDKDLEGVTSIATYAFAGNKKITSIDLSNITDIGEAAFYMCTTLQSVTLPTTLEAIPDGCFIGCEKLETVDMHGCTNLKTIGESAFSNSGIKSVQFAQNIDTIGQAAFLECEKLENVVIPYNVKKIDEATFFGCTNLKTVYFAQVTEIGDQAFTLSGITSIDSQYIDTIGYASFAACTGLQTISLPNVKTIGEAAFVAGNDNRGNTVTSLTTVGISNVVRIEDEAFSFQEKITFINIDNCEYIGANAFTGCTNLERVLASNIKYIGANAFNSAEAFTAFAIDYTSIAGVVLLPNTIEYVDSSAFVNTSIQQFYLEEGGSNDYFVDDGVLYRHVNNGSELVCFPTLKFYPISYDVREDTVRIDKYAFAGIENVIQVNIPDSVQAIGDAAFLYSSVKVFNFLGYKAPELEAYYSMFDSDYQDGTRSVYFWQVYRNFCYPFNYVNGSSSVFKYNSIRPYQDEELELYIDGYESLQGEKMHMQNYSYTGEGFSDFFYYYNIVLMYASNASGFDSFVWDNYFDSKVLKPELIEAVTEAVIELIRQLPAVDSLTINDRAAVELARARFDALTYNQMAFVKEAGLVDVLEDCEEQIALLATVVDTSLDDIIATLQALPDPANVTENDRAAIEAARAAYNALSEENKTNLRENNADLYNKLEACEQSLTDDGEEEKGCGSCSSCGTITFGAGGTGTGLMIGLGVMLIACLAVVLLRKRRANDKK